MDEVRLFCIRMLGDGPATREAEQAAIAAADGPGDRRARLTAAVTACRQRADDAAAPEAPEAPGEGGAGAGRAEARLGECAGITDLAAAVARELRAAVNGLPWTQREALALRDLLELSYEEMSAVTGIAAEDVAARLASARVALREQLRGPGDPAPDCAERDRALSAIARRQDDEPVSPADEEWLIDHLGHCGGCGRRHAALLEAVACYRAWAAAEAPPAAAS